jgi:hypothetical protein
MKKILFLAIVLVSGINTAMAQNVTVDVPSGYKVVIVPSSVTVSQAINVTTAPQTVYVAQAPVAAPAPIYHQRARHVASVAEGMVIEHQYDDHH